MVDWNERIRLTREQQAEEEKRLNERVKSNSEEWMREGDERRRAEEEEKRQKLLALVEPARKFGERLGVERKLQEIRDQIWNREGSLSNYPDSGDRSTLIRHSSGNIHGSSGHVSQGNVYERSNIGASWNYSLDWRLERDYLAQYGKAPTARTGVSLIVRVLIAPRDHSAQIRIRGGGNIESIYHVEKEWDIMNPVLTEQELNTQLASACTLLVDNQVLPRDLRYQLDQYVLQQSPRKSLWGRLFG